ncbi:TlpA disulfide reductase family protein [Scrofimicrobium sp. R131]|uniref:TlpA disulfide reductase family protein n=1 Tax=Scrofimicrobium appendicitidis TaxID=3079930 RepID=A0AAU7VBE6_9ACTO
MPEKRAFRETPLGNIVILAVVTLIVLAGIWLVGSWRDGGASAAAESGDTTGVSEVDVPDSGQPAPEVGQPAPAFTARTTGGDTFEVGEPGQPTWLIFNATWCSNCRAEVPDIQEVYQQVGDRAQIISVYVSDTPSAVLDYSAKLNLTYPQVIDSGNKIASLYRVMGLPTHYFLDADGNIHSVEVGTLGQAQVLAKLAELGVQVGG